MSHEVVTSESFARSLKRLAKKYPSLKHEVTALGESLAENPTQGTPLGKDCYKIRMAVQSKGKGKSGGTRIITFVVALTETVTLLSIYDKAEQDTISEQALEALLKTL